MSDSPPDPSIVAQRVRAAMALAGLSREDAAAAMHMSVQTLDRVTRARQPRGADWNQLNDLASACDIPFAWFWADLDRVEEIAPVDRAPALFNAGRLSAAASEPHPDSPEGRALAAARRGPDAPRVAPGSTRASGARAK